ncbi:helix-turn-helix transcriptional regulator [Salinigranum sp.]|uniref:helix-turn-helix transcriptional regulator n=1 Tax=Salinigranum sp. TaxID=1966351 RepID=UPI003566D4EB
MDDALAELRFLASSANRVRVLEALSDGATTRREVEARTGVARSTVARALDEAAERDWVDSEGSRYWTTPEGEARLSAFRTYLETTAGMQHLGPALRWLPDPVRALDYRHLRDAELTYPTDDNPAAPFDRGLAVLEAADEYRSLTQNSFPRYMAVVRDRVVAGVLDFEGIVADAFVETLRGEPDRARVWHDLADRVWVYDGHVPVNLQVADGTAVIWLCGPDHDGDDVVVKGLLESDDPAVVSWAESYYREFRAEADPIETTGLPVA